MFIKIKTNKYHTKRHQTENGFIFILILLIYSILFFIHLRLFTHYDVSFWIIHFCFDYSNFFSLVCDSSSTLSFPGNFHFLIQCLMLVNFTKPKVKCTIYDSESIFYVKFIHYDNHVYRNCGVILFVQKCTRPVSRTYNIHIREKCSNEMSNNPIACR